nr:multidrug and toxin extrusion protein 2-like [Lytechinus pictus]
MLDYYRSTHVNDVNKCNSNLIFFIFFQFYGSPKKKHIGVILQRGMLIMGLLCFVCWGILINAETILLLAHQSSEVARLTGVYCLIYIPAVPGDYVSMLLIKYLQCQSRLLPVVVTTLITNVIAAVLYYVFIYVFDLKLVGTAIAQVLSHYILTGLVTGYIVWKKLHKETWSGWSKECLDDWMPIFKLGMAGCMMVCLEWWSFDVGFYLAGLLDEESIGAHAIIMYTATTGYMFPYGIGIAASIRIGNSLGAKKPGIAHVASVASLSLGVVAAVILAILYISLKDLIPYLFTSESLTVKLASSILPICAMFALLDATATVCGGVIRGTGRQVVGAVVDLLGYYLIGLPLGISLMFPLHKGIYGFWSGMTLGLFIQSLFLVVFTLRLSWNNETRKAQKRIRQAGLHEEETCAPISSNHHAASQTELEGDEDEELITTNGRDNGSSDGNPPIGNGYSNGFCMKDKQPGTVVDSSSNTEGYYGDDQCDGIRPVPLHDYLQVRTDEGSAEEPNTSANNSSSFHQNGNIVCSEVTKMEEASRDLPGKTSVWELLQLRVMILCLCFVYLGLAIICRVLVVPDLRAIAIEREMSLANLTNVTSIFSPTEAVQYTELF